MDLNNVELTDDEKEVIKGYKEITIEEFEANFDEVLDDCVENRIVYFILKDGKPYVVVKPFIKWIS